MEFSDEETMMGPSEFGRTNPEGVLREEKNKGFPKAWKRDDLGRLIAETKSAF
jgi:hypothetical protein